jgi:hypothetical protein
VTTQFLQGEEAVAACMAEAGFEYVPTLTHFFVGEEDAPQIGTSRESAEQYGYGMTTGWVDPTVQQATGEDPNTAILAAMSDAERHEYLLAMTGPSSSSGSDGEADFADLGCYGRALELLETPAQQDPVYRALTAEMARIDADAVPADPRVVQADAEWSECMADAGHPGYPRQPDASARWAEELGDSYTAGGALAVRERALATADWDCRDQTGYDDVITSVRNELQQEYVDAHRDELDAWVERWATR